MSFQQGLSGLNATSKNLEVIGNNVANANTYGAKASRAEFADMYASAMNGAGKNLYMSYMLWRRNNDEVQPPVGDYF